MRFVFSEEQFLILTALSGIDELFLFKVEREPDEKSMAASVVSLYNSGYLKEHENGLILSEQLQELMNAIRDSKFVTRMDFCDCQEPQKLVYTSKLDQVVIMEKLENNRKPCVRLELLRCEEFVFDLFENEVFPESLIQDREHVVDLEENALAELPEQLDVKATVIRICRIRTEENVVNNRIDLIQTPLFSWIHLYEGYEEFYHIYSVNEMGELLLHELRGEEL